MTKLFKLNALARAEENGKVSVLRKEGFVPAVLYGKGEENILLKVKKLDIERTYEEAGESSLVDLEIGGNKEAVKVIIKDLQMDYVKDVILHADFYKVDMKKEIEVEIPLIFIGESKAVSELGGTLVKNLEKLNAKCLPTDLVEHLEVDVSALASFEDSIRVTDIKVPDTIKILNNPSDSLAIVLEQKEEEEIVPVVEDVEGEEVEGKDAKDGEVAPADAKETETKKGEEKK